MPEYLTREDVPFHIIEEDTYSVVKSIIPEGKTTCSLYSRLRRSNLYTFAEQIGATKIALDHHRDDIMETLFLNMFYGGKLKSMPPKLLSDINYDRISAKWGFVLPILYDIGIAHGKRHRYRIKYAIPVAQASQHQQTTNRWSSDMDFRSTTHLILIALSAFLYGCKLSNGPQQPVGLAPNGESWPNSSEYSFGTEQTPYQQIDLQEDSTNIATRTSLFLPIANAAPHTAGVVVYIHGAGNTELAKADAMIRHLTRQGRIVVFPRYCALICLDFADQIDTAKAAVKFALAYLEHADLDYQLYKSGTGLTDIVLVTHSMGSLVAAQVADDLIATDTANPKAMVFHDAAGLKLLRDWNALHCSAKPDCDPALYDPQGKTTHLTNDMITVLLAAEETIADPNGRITIAELWNHIPDHHTLGKQAYVVPSYSDDTIKLISDHDGSLSHEKIDAIDWWGYWLVTSAVVNYAFEGTHRDFFHGVNNLGLQSGGYLRDEQWIELPPKYDYPNPTRP